MAGNRMLSESDRGALLDLIDDATEIRAPDVLARWSGGALQKILPHRILACGVGKIRNRRLAFKPMLFEQASTTQPHSDVVASILDVIDQLLSHCLIQNVPQLLSGHPARAYKGNGLGNTAAYGVVDIDESAFNFIVMCGLPERLNSWQEYALKLLAPHLNVVLRQMNASQKTAEPFTVAPQVRLTDRESEVLRWLRQGNSALEVAQILGRSEHTVKNQMRRIYEKLGARNRAQALHQASKLSLPE
jgi:transcriptional regulator EpsA